MNADQLAMYAARNLFPEAVAMLPRVYWPGHESDLIVVTRKLQVIDVEIKVSRADFKVDRRKNKWWQQRRLAQFARYEDAGPHALRKRHFTSVLQEENLDWPRKVWKHYFLMPASIWTPELAEFLPSPQCGVILATKTGPQIRHEFIRKGRANPDFTPITQRQVLDLTRLSTLRFWDMEQLIINLSQKNQQLRSQHAQQQA